MGIEQLFEGKSQQFYKEGSEIMMNITKALILTLLNSKDDKKIKDGEKLKKDFLKDVIEKSLIQTHKDKPKEKLQQNLKMEELDLEIQQTRLNTIKKLLEDKNE